MSGNFQKKNMTSSSVCCDKQLDNLLENIKFLGHSRIYNTCNEILSLSNCTVIPSLQIHLQWGICSLTGTLCNRVMRVGPYVIDAHFRVFVIALWLTKHFLSNKSDVVTQQHMEVLEKAKEYCFFALHTIMQ